MRIKQWIEWNLNLGYHKSAIWRTHKLWLWLIGFEWNKYGIILVVRKPFSILWRHKFEFSFEDKKFHHWHQNV